MCYTTYWTYFVRWRQRHTAPVPQTDRRVRSYPPALRLLLQDQVDVSNFDGEGIFGGRVCLCNELRTAQSG